VSGGESQETGVDGLYAEAAHDSQCNAEEQDAVAACDGTGRCRGIGDPGLDEDRPSYANCVRRLFTSDSDNTLLGS